MPADTAMTAVSMRIYGIFTAAVKSFSARCVCRLHVVLYISGRALDARTHTRTHARTHARMHTHTRRGERERERERETHTHTHTHRQRQRQREDASTFSAVCSKSV